MGAVRQFFSVNPDDFVTSARLELRGGHEHVAIWVHHQAIGAVILDQGDGEKFLALLQLIERAPPDPYPSTVSRDG